MISDDARVLKVCNFLSVKIWRGNENEFISLYTPKQSVSIDEAMISFKAELVLKQYIKNTPNPWSIKAYALAESGSGYIYV